MKSVILAALSRLIFGLLLLFSIFLLLRGHNLPGGGFVGGLVAAGAFVLQALAEGFAESRRRLRLPARVIMGIGLLVAITSGILGMFYGYPFLTGIWTTEPLPLLGKLGTPLMFDLGVYLTVLGVTCQVVFSLGEEEEKS
jgi:multicomponent Na+:H+ antiporter subunit B